MVTSTLLFAVLMIPLSGQDSGRGAPASVEGDWMSDGVSTVDELGLLGGTETASERRHRPAGRKLREGLR